jgi:hypothetical protein
MVIDTPRSVRFGSRRAALSHYSGELRWSQEKTIDSSDIEFDRDSADPASAVD